MKRFFSILAAVLLVAGVFAQTPERISYQAVVRNTKGLLIINKEIGMEINIRQGSPTGTIVYTETQTPTTNANGLVSIEIGDGQGFSAISWGDDTYFIETKTAVEPPLTTYTITGISKLLSVPYSLHAKTAETITGSITETDPLYSGSQASNITAADITKLSNLSGVNTGDQDLSGLATTASVTTGLATKVDKVEGKGLSTNDYTTTDQTKLAGIATGAEVNVNADWNATSGDAQILNKPAIVNADWNATTGAAQILNKPTIAIADWNATSGAAQILNKPAIPGAADLVKLSNLSGVNTGDQDLSGLATTASVTTGLATKVDKVEGKGLSTNDYTTADQTKLAGIATGAEVIANADWNATTGAAQILNKPAIPSAADLVKISNLSGVNTGDQDLSGLATTASVTTGLATKVDKVEGKGLSTNDYTTADQTKLAGIATGAEVNVNADWNATSGDAQILNKPAIANADWNATSGAAQILNKPAIANADWNATSGAAQILNKPTIPAVADGSETKVTAGTNVTVTGTGTSANPYVVNAQGPTTFTIGQSYQGGVIFWLDATGQHGLIAATVDQGHLIKWSKNNDRIIGATGNGMYAGAMNTAIIVAALMPEQQTETFAAQLCADYSVTVDGVMYGDWYLPSIYELKLLQQKKDIVGNFIAEGYWSSTEYTQTGHPDYPKLMAYELAFDDILSDPTGDYKYSSSYANVRAIRAF